MSTCQHPKRLPGNISEGKPEPGGTWGGHSVDLVLSGRCVSNVRQAWLDKVYNVYSGGKVRGVGVLLGEWLGEPSRH